LYKFVNKKDRVIVFFADIIGFVLWTIFHIFTPWKILGKNHLPTQSDKILLIRVDYIGDVLLTTHTLKAIRKRFPASHISFLVSSQNSSFETSSLSSKFEVPVISLFGILWSMSALKAKLVL